MIDIGSDQAERKWGRRFVVCIILMTREKRMIDIVNKLIRNGDMRFAICILLCCDE